jgi:hypothetical protein
MYRWSRSCALTEHHAMKAAPRILGLGIRWRWVVSFTPRPLQPLGKSPWYPLDRRMGRPQSRSGRSGDVWQRTWLLPSFCLTDLPPEFLCRRLVTVILLRIQEIPGSNFSPDAGCHFRCLHDFSSYLLTNTGILFSPHLFQLLNNY